MKNVLFVCCLILCSCSVGYKIKSTGDKLILPNDLNASFNASRIIKCFKIGEMNYLSWFCDSLKSIYLYDMDRNKLDKCINLKDAQIFKGNIAFETPMGVFYTEKRLIGYEFYNNTYCLIMEGNNAVIVDLNGNYLHEYNLDSEFNRMSNTIYPVDGGSFYYQDSLILAYEYISSGSPLEIGLNPSHLLYDIKQGKTIGHYIPYPSEYQLGSWWHYTGYEMSVCQSEDTTFLISYPTSPMVGKFNLKTLETTFTKVQSNYLPDSIPIYPLDKRGDNEYLIEYLSKTPKYGRIHYDKVNDVYLRVAKHGQAFYNSDSTINTYEEAPWSIIFFNKDFEVLNEQSIASDRLSFSNIYFLDNKVLIKDVKEKSNGKNIYHIYEVKL
jgi:hypothetical protein